MRRLHRSPNRRPSKSFDEIDCLFPFKRIDLIERTAFAAVCHLSCGTLTGTDTFEQQPEAKLDLNVIQGDTSLLQRGPLYTRPLLQWGEDSSQDAWTSLAERRLRETFDHFEWRIATFKNKLVSTLRITAMPRQCPSRSGANPEQISGGFGGMLSPTLARGSACACLDRRAGQWTRKTTSPRPSDQLTKWIRFIDLNG